MAITQFINKLMKYKLGLILIGVLLIGATWFLIGRAGGGFKVTELKVGGGGKTGFTLLPPQQTGIAFANSLRDEQATANQLLNIGSGVALRGMAARAHYTASKAGVVGLTRSLCKELGPRGIRGSTAEGTPRCTLHRRAGGRA